MRLSELFEDAETAAKERAFQDAWTAAGPMLKAKGIPPSYHGRVQSRAHELAISYEQDVDDAISTAASEVGAKIKKQTPATTSQQSQQSRKLDNPYADRAKQAARADRVGRSGKRWGNQYYSDPTQSGGVKGSLAKLTPKAMAKRAVDKVDQELGKAIDIDRALAKTGSLNKNSRRRR